jgi:hypothetical protein
MTTWTNDELPRIEHAEELQMTPSRSDGTPHTPVPIWVVRDGDDLYVRSFRGSAGAWYRAARASHEGRIRSGGVDKDVTLVEVTDPGVNDASTPPTAPSTSATARVTSIPWWPRETRP